MKEESSTHHATPNFGFDDFQFGNDMDIDMDFDFDLKLPKKF